MAVIGGRVHGIEQIHDMGRLKYPFAEICLYEPDEVNRQMKDLLEWRDRYGIYYLAHYPNEDNPMDAGVLREKFLPKMKLLLELSSYLDIRKGTMHFWIDKRWAPKELLPAKIEILKELTDFASVCGVTLCIENLTERYESFADAFDTAPDLRMTLDIGHGELLSKENTSINFIEHLFHKIEHIHVHDNHGGTTVKDDLHLPPGEGRIDYPRILSMLKERDFSKTITMEIKPEQMPAAKEFLERYLV